mgnify:FL=1
MAKANVLRLLLQEAKKQKLKWLVQQGGANLFPNEDDYHDYDNWKYTNKIKETVDFVDNIYNEAYIIFDKGGWCRYIKQYDEHSCEDLSDWTTNHTWIDDLSNRLEQTHP